MSTQQPAVSRAVSIAVLGAGLCLFVPWSPLYLIARRRVPWKVIVFVSAMTVWRVAAGQQIAHLPSYFTTSIGLMVGHKEGMGRSIPGSDGFAVPSRSAPDGGPFASPRPRLAKG